MGLGHSPSIPLTNLALFYDAANSKSYSSSGSVFTDLSGNGLTGTINNAPVFSYSAGGNFTFNGTSNTVSFTRKRFTAGLTYAAWIKTTSSKNTATYTTTTANPIVGDINNAVWNGFGVHNGKLRYCYYNRAGSAVITSDSTASVNTGSWIHVAVTHSYTETAKLYINGVLDSTFNVATTGANDPWAQFLAADRIGTGYSSSDFFNGSIAQVTLYSVDLTAANILALYSASRERFNATAVNLSGAVLNLDAANSSSYSGSGTAWNDLSGNAYNATLTNGPTYSSSNSGFITFDGTDDYAGLAHSGLVDLGNDYTVTAFIKLTNTTQSIASIFSNMDVNNGVSTKGISFYWFKTSEYGMGANVLRLQQGASGWFWNVYASDANTITDTNWHFVSLTVSNALTANPTVTFNVDGTNKTTTFWNQSSKAAANYTSATGSIRVGSIYTASAPAYSTSYGALSVANLRVYKRALSNQEIGVTFDALRGRFGL